MMVNSKNRHHMTINNLPRLLGSLSVTHRGAYHFCLNKWNGFRIVSAMGGHCGCCGGNGRVKVRVRFEGVWREDKSNKSVQMRKTLYQHTCSVWIVCAEDLSL